VAAVANHDGIAAPVAVVADHIRCAVLDRHGTMIAAAMVATAMVATAMVATAMVAVAVRKGGTTREAESESGEGEDFQHHAQG
jgi:hypothetical protein